MAAVFRPRWGRDYPRARSSGHSDRLRRTTDHAVGGFWSEAGAWNFGVEYWAQLITQQLFYLLSGLAIGMILLNSAAAIVVSFMLPLVFSILVGVIPWLESKGPWIDKNVSMQDFLVPTPRQCD